MQFKENPKNRYQKNVVCKNTVRFDRTCCRHYSTHTLQHTRPYMYMLMPTREVKSMKFCWTVFLGFAAPVVSKYDLWKHDTPYTRKNRREWTARKLYICKLARKLKFSPFIIKSSVPRIEPHSKYYTISPTQLKMAIQPINLEAHVQVSVASLLDFFMYCMHRLFIAFCYLWLLCMLLAKKEVCFAWQSVSSRITDIVN